MHLQKTLKKKDLLTKNALTEKGVLAKYLKEEGKKPAEKGAIVSDPKKGAFAQSLEVAGFVKQKKCSCNKPKRKRPGTQKCSNVQLKRSSCTRGGNNNGWATPYWTSRKSA